MFESTVERLLAKEVTPALIASAESGAWPVALWQAIEDNGLPLAAASEQFGGIGGSWHDAFVLVRAAGRHAAPIPLGETIAVNWLLGASRLDVVDGPATLALGSDGKFDGGRFDGILTDVPWGRNCSHVLTLTAGEQPLLVLLTVADAEISTALNMAREPRDTLRFANVKPVATAPIEGIGVLQAGAMIRSAQIAGGLQRLLDITIEYANQRQQFGRPIAKFQAIQHQVALLSEHAAICDAASETAFAMISAGPSALAVASAKCITSEAAGGGAAIAHSVLGAIGFTYEHALRFTTRRLWAWRSEFGSQSYWATQIGSAACLNGAKNFWPALTGDSLAD